jgi:hypothetical protein
MEPPESEDSSGSERFVHPDPSEAQPPNRNLSLFFRGLEEFALLDLAGGRAGELVFELDAAG